MADFCKECSIEIFGRDFGDLAGITKDADQAANRYANVLCEGCGAIQVDVDGKCVTENCDGDHRKPK